MTIWLPQVEGRPGPRYLAIAQALQEDIEQGRLGGGSRLPTHRELAYRLGVTVGTVSRAYLEAERRGLIEGQVGRGTFVRQPAATPAFAIRREGGIVDLSLNLAPVAGMASVLAPALTHLARHRDLASLLAYQHELGLPAHRAAGAAWLARTGVATAPERVAITGGAQHALHASLTALTRPGDTILLEGLAYPGAKVLASQLGLQVRDVAIDGEGLRPDALEAACQEERTRVLVTMPTLHNPTTATQSAERRRQIIEVARRHDLMIVEDDIYGFLLESPPEPLAALAPERCIYLTSLSKSVAAGLRLGYLAAPVEWIGRIGAAVRGTIWMASPLLAEIAARWVRDGTAARLADERRDFARRRQGIAARALAGQRLESHPASFHLWLHLPEPWRWSDFVAAAERRGVRVTPPDLFATGRAAVPHAVRLCLSAVESEARLEEALATLAALLAAPPEPRLAVV
jgi:DNA-binding transcriptional MocR family regulator